MFFGLIKKNFKFFFNRFNFRENIANTIKNSFQILQFSF